MLNNKKGEIITIILIVIIVIVALAWLVNLSNRECDNNNDCNPNSYCGSDFKCHEFPVIEKEVAKNSLLMPSIILGIAIIVSSYILRTGKRTKKEIPPQQHNQLY